MSLDNVRLELLRDNVQKMRIRDVLDTYQEGWDDAVCVILDIVDIYLKEAYESK